jgi:1,4-dihydroxy-2-naphthoate octaprenyltransferase
VTQSGLLKPGQVVRGMWFVFSAAALLGLYLIWAADWSVLVMGGALILAEIAYSGGPSPYRYYGLGDAFVFIFFGLVAVCGAYFVQTGEVCGLARWV